MTWRDALGEHDRSSRHPPAAGERLLFVLADVDAKFFRKCVHDHPANVVAAARVLGSGIAESNDQLHCEKRNRRQVSGVRRSGPPT